MILIQRVVTSILQKARTEQDRKCRHASQAVKEKTCFLKLLLSAWGQQAGSVGSGVGAGPVGAGPPEHGGWPGGAPRPRRLFLPHRHQAGAPGAVGTGRSSPLSPVQPMGSSKPINRLPRVRGIELPDLCLPGPPPLPPSWVLWGQGLAGCWLQTAPVVAVVTGSGWAII